MSTDRPSLMQKYQDTYLELQKVMQTLNRIDERVDIFIENQRNLEQKFTDHVETCQNSVHELSTKISIVQAANGSKTKEELKGDLDSIEDDADKLEERVRKLELSQQSLNQSSASHDNKWKTIGMFVLQVMVYITGIVLASALWYNFGIRANNGP